MKIKWFSIVRIVGLVMVLAYHFYPKQVTGGFIGVDLFFTFSGFLITSLIIDEFAKKNNFELLAFYRRRFNRIVPALLLSVVIVLPLSLLISRDFLASIGKQVAAALGFVTNYYEIMTGGNYENQFMPHLFVHTWTLALELHFYILWGLIVWLIIKHLNKDRFAHADKVGILRRRIGLLSAIFVGAELFAVFYYLAAGANVNYIYFADVTHAFPFFVGALLASFSGIRQLPVFFTRIMQRQRTWLPVMVMLLSICGLTWLTYSLKFDQTFTYQYGILLASLATALMIAAARVLHDKTPNLAEPALITFLADISYSVYLYHWPLIIIFGHLMNHQLAVGLTIVLSIVFSIISYYGVEPILTRSAVGLSQQLLKQLVMAAMIAGIGFAVIICQRAPQMSSLSRNLWIGNLQQDVDQLTALETTVTNQNAPKVKVPAGTTIIGDSVTLGTRGYLGDHVPDSTIDAQPNRNMTEANDVLANQIRNKTLRQNVVLCVGTNSLNDYEEQLMKLIKALPAGHRLILMTPFDGQADASWNSSKLTVLERSLPAKYPYISIADWNKLAGEHREIFGSGDGTHFAGNPAGDKLYADCINDALKKAENSPVKK